jgi:hypothetical protein
MSVTALTPLQQKKRYRLKWIIHDLVNNYDPDITDHNDQLKNTIAMLMDTMYNNITGRTMFKVYDQMVFDEELRHTISRTVHFLSKEAVNLSHGMDAKRIVLAIENLRTVPKMTTDDDVDVHTMYEKGAT